MTDQAVLLLGDPSPARRAARRAALAERTSAFTRRSAVTKPWNWRRFTSRTRY